MPHPSSLQSLFQSNIEDSSSDFEKTVYHSFFSKENFSKELLQRCFWEELFISEESIIKNWKRLLTLNLLCNLKGIFREEMGEKVRFYERQPWNQGSQYLRSIVALNHALAKMPIPEAGPHLLASGAALIELREYCPWMSLPYIPHHLEFGIFLSLLGLITKRQEIQEVVLKLANWQLNTLDIKGDPFSGLFVRERDYRMLEQHCLCYLLFKGAALFDGQSAFFSFSEVALNKMTEMSKSSKEKLDPLWLLVEKWMEQFKLPSLIPFSLPESVYDPSTALVGYRSEFQHVICTLHGAHTGLGAIKLGKNEIVNYGPQYLPLEECQGFGIEGNAISDQGMRRTTIETRKQGFTLKGCTRLVDQPASHEAESGKFRGIWLEVIQEFKKPHLCLKTSFLGLDGWDSIAFCFYVKAARCKTGSTQICLLPFTLEGYEGENQAVLLEGDDQTILELRPLFKGNMKIIPLAGGNNFWGADFLIAYLMSSDHRHYQWNIGPLSR